ncbi:MAG: hypothetical protein CL897_03105 [Dehalococcoidia bacterium]|nr:hypothetical protein [Dehalococcoidia bacterium]|tara:strand:+ start:14165 stop:15520 length:1356 start_codon:yes stop_codon:yes gene_type:complete
MRILTIGYSLPNQNVDNHTVLNAPSLTDYEAVLIDPEAITTAVQQLLEGERSFNSLDGRPVVNGATTATQVSAADQLLRRTDEAQRFLEQGGALFVIGRPNAVLPGVIGFEGFDRFGWLPAPKGGGWNPPNLRAAEGKTIRIADDKHPLSAVLREHRRDLTYRAVLDPAITAGTNEGHVIAMGGSNMPIAVEFPVLAGRVVVTPVFANTTGTARTKLAQDMVDAMTAVATGAKAEDAPGWARTLALPSSEQIEAELEEAEESESAATARTAAVRERLDALTAHRRLLWATGSDFSAAVREALALLGLDATTAADGLAVTEGEHTALVEVESSREDVAEWPYVRLQRRLERHLLDEGEQLRGIIVVNGKRTMSPTARRGEFTDALRVACENYGYALTTGQTLFALVQRALGTDAPSGTLFEAAGRRLLHGKGMITTEQAVGEAEEAGDASIF